MRVQRRQKKRQRGLNLTAHKRYVYVRVEVPLNHEPSDCSKRVIDIEDMCAADEVGSLPLEGGGHNLRYHKRRA
jgi:hypothetical protein